MINKEKEKKEDISSAFVAKHLNKELRRRGLMVSNKGETTKKIKQILGKYYLNLASKIEHIAKNLAKRTIITSQMVDSAYTML